MNPLRFDGQVALVTGGAGGIGKAFCKLLAERGAKVVVNGNYRPSGSGPEEDLVAEIRASGGEAVGVNGSTTDEEAVVRMVSTAIDSYGRLDIVVSNAGTTGIHLPVQQCPGPEVEEQLEVHVRGTMRVVRAAWPHLAASGAGRIMTTGSAAGFGYGGPWGWDGAYCVAKAAMFGVTRQMAGAGEEVGIKVNMVMPWAYTDMTKAAIDGTELGNWIQAKLGTAMIPPAMLYLLHRDCPVTGQFFSTGGGRVARVAFASNKGYLNPALTPEDVVENWDQIYGQVDAQGDLDGMFEVHELATEFEVLQRMLG